jgi:hypothetical protein
MSGTGILACVGLSSVLQPAGTLVLKERKPTQARMPVPRASELLVCMHLG